MFILTNLAFKEYKHEKIISYPGIVFYLFEFVFESNFNWRGWLFI